jgi:hypothetical protein
MTSAPLPSAAPVSVRRKVEDSLATLAHEELVHRGRDNEITVAYPFSGRPSAHREDAIASGRAVFGDVIEEV